MSCAITSEQAAQVFATQASRLYGMIGASLAIDSPYINVLEKGTFPAAIATQLTSVIQGRSAPGDSKVFPTFENQVTVCTGSGLRDGNGTNQYFYNAKIKQSIGDRICFNAGFLAFAGSLNAQFQATQKLVTEYINADIRAELFTRSGVKAVVRSGVSATAMIAGGYNQIDTAVPAIESDARLTFGLLEKFASYMRERLKVNHFGSGANTNLRFIGGWDILAALRNDLGGAVGSAGTLTPFNALVAGGDKMASDGTKSYAFTQTYRGIEFGKDQEPMRANWTGAAYAFVEPDLAVAGSSGTVAAPNPAYDESSHEVGFLIGKGSFERQVPAPWTGEGKMKFERQLFGGEVMWHSVVDNCENPFGNWGALKYQIGRAFRPLYPWFVMPIIYKRCNDDAIASCSGISGL